SAMLRPATRLPSTSRARGSLPDHALGQVTASHLHGYLVRGPVLPAAALRLSRAGRGPDFHRTLQADGAQAVLGNHDAGRGAHHRVRRLAVARLVQARHRLAPRQDRAGRHPRRLPPVVLAPAARFRRRAQPAWPRLVPLVQRVSGSGADRHGAAGCLQALLTRSSPPRRGGWRRCCKKKFLPWEEWILSWFRAALRSAVAGTSAIG